MLPGYCGMGLHRSLIFIVAIAADSSTQLPLISLPAGQHVSLDIIISSPPGLEWAPSHLQLVRNGFQSDSYKSSEDTLTLSKLLSRLSRSAKNLPLLLYADDVWAWVLVSPHTRL